MIGMQLNFMAIPTSLLFRRNFLRSLVTIESSDYLLAIFKLPGPETLSALCSRL